MSNLFNRLPFFYKITDNQNIAFMIRAQHTATRLEGFGASIY